MIGKTLLEIKIRKSRYINIVRRYWCLWGDLATCAPVG